MMRYTEELTLSQADFDLRGNLLPRVALTAFQTLANHHAEALGVGFEAMLERKLLWVVTHIKYQVLGRLAPGERVTGVTWPLPQSRVGFTREYLLCAAGGEPVIKGTSGWALIDADTRQLAVSASVYPQGEYCLERNFAERVRRIRDFEGEEACLVTPDGSTIDENGHVNNTHYADFALTALGGLPGELDTFQIDYIHEVLCGETLRLFRAETDGSRLVKGVSEEKGRMFTCCITLQ